MPVDCVNQMLMKSVNTNVEHKSCGIAKQSCPGPEKCLNIADPDATRRYRRNAIAYDVHDDNPEICIMVGSELWKRIKPG